MEAIDIPGTEEITKVQLHSYAPFLNNFQNNNEIRITVNSSSFLQINQSFLYIRVKMGKLPRTESKITLVRNGILHLFSECKIELNGKILEWSKLPAITNTVMTYLTGEPFNAPGDDEYQWPQVEMAKNSQVDFTIPLKRIFGFCRDYNKFMIYSRFDLILVRARSDFNSLYLKTLL